MQGYIKSLLSLLVVLPENPENDYLHISTGFKAAMDLFKWNKKTGIFNKIIFLIDFVAFLCIQLQPRLPYHYENVKSNDSLFVENEFKLEVVERINETLTEVTTLQNELDFQTLDSNVNSKIYTTNHQNINKNISIIIIIITIPLISK
jgi:hypothetical protein